MIDVDDDWSELKLNNDNSKEENKIEIQNKDIIEPKSSMKFHTDAEVNDIDNKDRLVHHDSDTESFYNIWGEDKDWLYGDELRNTVRKIHRYLKNCKFFN